jgi:hypothetical protein
MTIREGKTTRRELKNEQKLVDEAVIKNAIESRRFLVKFDRLYISHGGMIDLIPKANYIIINGDQAIISAAYFGRQYDTRPIAGINMRGKPVEYDLTSNSTKGKFDIKMKIQSETNSFNVYMTIHNDGTCDASINNIKLDYVRYTGHFVLISDDKNNPPPKNEIIM